MLISLSKNTVSDAYQIVDLDNSALDKLVETINENMRNYLVDI